MEVIISVSINDTLIKEHNKWQNKYTKGYKVINNKKDLLNRIEEVIKDFMLSGTNNFYLSSIRKTDDIKVKIIEGIK